MAKSKAVVAVASAVAVAAVAAAAASPTSAESWRSTEWQTKLLEELEEQSKQRSEAANPSLLAELAKPEFLQNLKDCGVAEEVRNLTAADLAQRLRDEVDAVEVVTNFFSHGISLWAASINFSMSLPEAMTGPGFLESNWEVMARHGVNFSELGPQGEWLKIQDGVETGIYGFKPFQNPGAPKSFAEAAERPAYFMANLFKIDAGSQLYGDVGLVVASDLAKATSVVSPVDTGGWTGMCNGTSINSSRPWPPHFYHPNCSSFKNASSVGNLKHFDHLFQTNAHYWKTNLSKVACRLLTPWGTSPLEGKDLVHYWEVMPSAELQFPKSIKFVIGSFPDLFGSVHGFRLQEWCIQQGWVLVWSLGLNLGTSFEQRANFFTAGQLPSGEWASADRRVLDPVVLARVAASFNSSRSSENAAQAKASFEAAWAQANVTRNVARAVNRTVANVTWALAWSDLMDLVPADVKLEPLKAGACKDINACLGTNPSGDCLCYNTQQTQQQQQQRTTEAASALSPPPITPSLLMV
mmetsp:Transcript_86598/g.181434  ORF Transcript_86598/g.181434 Transcript_86598/m.181434 type:complete len:524 (-) Transcript_86598:174-1745(-)|eukprot:CAMPEP_0206445788 /NCGR_PEP_ID=MMETSP0324_2-20121206/15730_1 /ASSEMBLY_ACC=CAM_ASM_000836 /TAXON_ID=2866 /ORGANISM="Crypthecodinium cohnii, Strain Seligo" /LENGTH=523 /DNA_ID=CAMNT_0053914097 /DNA_START=146 /DNA_END=1717 /DNA_ORIENTATION=-